MITDDAREVERTKYVRAYSGGGYRMSERRLLDATSDLQGLQRGSFLDVSCGYGAMIQVADGLGFAPCRGTEILDHLCDGETVVKTWAHALPFPDKSFDVVMMTDVIEHLIPGDDESACLELNRVARRHVIISANNRPSCRAIGEDLHINKRPHDEWDRLFRKWFEPAKVKRLRRRHDIRANASAWWRIDL